MYKDVTGRLELRTEDVTLTYISDLMFVWGGIELKVPRVGRYGGLCDRYLRSGQKIGKVFFRFPVVPGKG